MRKGFLGLAGKERLVARAEEALGRGDAAAARRLLARAVRREPGDLRLRIRLAAVLVRVGEMARAVDILRDVAARYREMGQPVAAVRVYQHLLQFSPDDVDARLALADTYASMGLRNDAASEYRAAIAILTALGEDAARLAAVERLLRLDPANVAGRVRLAEEYAARGDMDAAATHFREAAERLWEAAAFDDYVAVAERLLFCDERDFVTARRLAAVHAKRGQPHKALPLLEQCFRRKQDDPEVLEALATVFEALHQFGKAAIVWKLLARLWRRRGDDERARAAWDEVLRLDPEDVEARRELSADAAQESAGREIEFDQTGEPMPAAPPPLPEAAQAEVPPRRSGPPELETRSEAQAAPASSHGMSSSGAGGGPWQEEPTLVDEEIPQRVLEVVRQAAPVDIEPLRASGARRLEEALREFDFFADQGLWKEARAILEEIPVEYAQHPEVVARRRAAERRRDDSAEGPS